MPSSNPLLTPDRITPIAGGIVIADISDLLPKHRLKTRRYPKRQKLISKLYFHKSGILGADGFRGPYNSTVYCITKRKYKKTPLIPGWAGMPYTFWNPYNPVHLLELIALEDFIPFFIEPDDLVLFRCQPDELRTWHTGDWANQIGISCVFQGTGKKLSPSQIEITEAFIPWAVDFYGLDMPSGLSWHSDRSEWGPPRKKPVCPGPAAVEYLENYRKAA